jgi:hypothetical protein
MIFQSPIGRFRPWGQDFSPVSDFSTNTIDSQILSRIKPLCRYKLQVRQRLSPLGRANKFEDACAGVGDCRPFAPWFAIVI